jgi:hypothetical protein
MKDNFIKTVQTLVAIRKEEAVLGKGTQELNNSIDALIDFGCIKGYCDEKGKIL